MRSIQLMALLLLALEGIYAAPILPGARQDLSQNTHREAFQAENREIVSDDLQQVLNEFNHTGVEELNQRIVEVMAGLGDIVGGFRTVGMHKGPNYDIKR
ncbi:hypothetical protein BCR33DRAFT_712345 [Rhizoclosmatium globosum]|uniref:Uncharacterized protein n=1 Tax=Rhizoclosmatium globosum TaxID=329046 RepID=A0A1Y2CW27_9FUNG|nr:hypothetical protein BCR33DRAFT_712345 [Rhizoclosmatium globosum]|eukprot:ORY51239.1 hypothetical protein BCR33DRAFT_712345 [Rhizoclosmatium globosum]